MPGKSSCESQSQTHLSIQPSVTLFYHAMEFAEENPVASSVPFLMDFVEENSLPTMDFAEELTVHARTLKHVSLPTMDFAEEVAIRARVSKRRKIQAPLTTITSSTLNAIAGAASTCDERIDETAEQRHSTPHTISPRLPPVHTMKELRRLHSKGKQKSPIPVCHN